MHYGALLPSFVPAPLIALLPIPPFPLPLRLPVPCPCPLPTCPFPRLRPIAFGRFSNYARRRPPRGQPPVLGAGGRVVCGGGDVGDCFVREHLVEWAAQFRPPESEQQQQQQQRQQRQQEQQAGSEHPERGLQEGSVSGFGGGSSGSSSAEGSSRNRSRSRRSKGASAGAGQQRRQQRELLARKRDRRQASSSASSPSPSSSSSSQPSPSTQPWHVDVSLHGRLSMADHAAYRWLLHLDGVALSSRLEQLLVGAGRGVGGGVGGGGEGGGWGLWEEAGAGEGGGWRAVLWEWARTPKGGSCLSGACPPALPPSTPCPSFAFVPPPFLN